MIETILSVLITLASILLILVVFVQNPKGGGLSTDFGSSTQLGGVKQTNEFIDKLTWGLAATIVACSIVITLQQPSTDNSNPKTPEAQETSNAPAGQKGQQNQNTPGQ
ncbi:MAG: preprotein translocase subunit SecG [Flavobacteriia bacterium]|jgi:preprotein translocase subunit SecG|nr:preprotein translocase subunit SecG [Flavobacteriia bacterium]NBV68381.1 preprotein translocase subunit SecG [Flavobacteriia bacterium]NBY40702.1 preprotein translocase subunit SecG [Flavobacteriia bacterium]